MAAPVSPPATKTPPSPSPPTASSGTAKRTCSSPAATAIRSLATSSTAPAPSASPSAKTRKAQSWNKGPCTQFSITGNFIKRSGKFAPADSPDSAQILLDGSTGVTCTGNTLQSGRDDGDQGVWSPSYGIIVQNLENCVIANNVLHNGALRQLIVDNGNHKDGVILKDNPGRLFHPPTS